jgi:hypothetical protein
VSISDDGCCTTTTKGINLKCKSLNSHFAIVSTCYLPLTLFPLSSLTHSLNDDDVLGMNKGIHTVIIGDFVKERTIPKHVSLFLFSLSIAFNIAVTSCNDVIAIFLFGVLLGIAFSTGNLTHQLLQGPVGIVMGELLNF